MVAEYWTLGEGLQDRIGVAGYESESVDSIAVDVHDLLQASDRIREEILPAALSDSGDGLLASLKLLKFELEHIRWHASAAESHLRKALAVLEPASEQPI